MSMLVVQRFFFSALLSLDGTIAFCLAICIFLILVSTFLVACFSTFFIVCSSLRAFFLSVFYAFCATIFTFLLAAYTFLVLTVATFLAIVVAFFSATADNLASFWVFFFLAAIDSIGLFIGGLSKLVAKGLSALLDSDLKELPRELANKRLYMTLNAVRDEKLIAALYSKKILYLRLTWGVGRWGPVSPSVVILG